MNWRDMPSLSALRGFAAFAETGSFSAAGALLNVSHAAISQQVRGLEADLGVPLADRDGRGLRLTPEGEELARELTRGFGVMGEAIETLRGIDTARPLQLSMTPSFASLWMMPRLHDFRRRHPGIELMINPSAEIVTLSPGGVDAAIRFGDGHWPGLDAQMLVPTTYVIAAHRDLVEGRRIDTPRDLLELPWMQEYGTHELSAWVRKQGITEQKHRDITHLPGHMLVQALKAGQAVGATVDVYITEEVARGDVKILFSEDRPNSGYYLVTRPGVQRAPLRIFNDWVKRQAATGTT